jgi:membrane protein
MGISKAFNNTYHAIDARPALKQRGISFVLVLIFTILIVTAIGFIIGGKVLVNYLEYKQLVDNSIGVWALVVGKWITVMALMFMAISFIYYLAPANQKYYKFISAGSTLATLMSLLLIVGFDAYISNFTHYNVLYGSIGTLIAMMVFLYFNSMVLLIGFELNVSIYQARINYVKD